MQNIQNNKFSMSMHITNKEKLLVFLLIGLVLIGFNFPDIFLSKTMYMDDNHRYIIGLGDKVYSIIFDRNPLRAYAIFPLYKLLSIDLVYARLAQTVVFYIPLAFFFYLLIRVHAQLPVSVAFFASVLPCILPGQTQIPSFIDDSYTVQGLLVFLLMLHLSLKYSELKAFPGAY